MTATILVAFGALALASFVGGLLVPARPLATRDRGCGLPLPWHDYSTTCIRKTNGCGE